MTKEITPEINAALIQAAATLANRDHELLLQEYFDSQEFEHGATRKEARSTPMYAHLISRKYRMEIFARVLDDVKALAEKGYFPI